jgi:hypothetical protein
MWYHNRNDDKLKNALVLHFLSIRVPLTIFGGIHFIMKKQQNYSSVVTVSPVCWFYS